ncbi:MAG: hypothetical protein HC882_04835 [Acidobacteria bacterium]|nr:hypothetical protein [Acidobacteriota bacterium]
MSRAPESSSKSTLTVLALGIAALVAGFIDNRYFHGASRGGIDAVVRMLAAFGLPYAIAGLVAGALWPDRAPRHALLLLSPLLYLLGASVLFAGYLGEFVTRDLPVAAILLVIAFGAAWLGGLLRQRRARPSE